MSSEQMSKINPSPPSCSRPVCIFNYIAPRKGYQDCIGCHYHQTAKERLQPAQQTIIRSLCSHCGEFTWHLLTDSGSPVCLDCRAK